MRLEEIMYNPNKNYYGILGVQPNCTIDDMVETYYNRILNRDNSYDLKNISEIKEAYGVLSNPRLRKRYDEYRMLTN